MESNWPETSRNLFLDQKKPTEYRRWTRRVPGCPRGWGRAPLPRGQPGDPLTYFFLPYIPIYPKNFGEHNRSGVPPLEASVATENQSRPVPAPYWRGNPSPVAIFIIPCSPWRVGSSSPSGLRVCTSSYVFDLSLSRVLEVARSCIASFAIIVGSYDVFSPALLSCNWLSFPFEVILSDWVFKDLRTLDVCLAWDNCGDNGLFYWFTWCMFWWSTCGFLPWTYA